MSLIEIPTGFRVAGSAHLDDRYEFANISAVEVAITAGRLAEGSLVFIQDQTTDGTLYVMLTVGANWLASTVVDLNIGRYPSIGDAGAIQFSNGANGFDSNNDIFHFNDTTKKFVVGDVTFSVEIQLDGSITTIAHGTTANWFNAYNNYIASGVIIGTDLQLTQRDGGTIGLIDLSSLVSASPNNGTITITNGSGLLNVGSPSFTLDQAGNGTVSFAVDFGLVASVASVTANAGNISTNAGNISANTGNININATGISNNVTALAGKVDDAQVLTNVPSGALFTDTVYTHPTTPGNKHIPTGGTVGQILINTTSGDASWQTAPGNLPWADGIWTRLDTVQDADDQASIYDVVYRMDKLGVVHLVGSQGGSSIPADTVIGWLRSGRRPHVSHVYALAAANGTPASSTAIVDVFGDDQGVNAGKVLLRDASSSGNFEIHFHETTTSGL